MRTVFFGATETGYRCCRRLVEIGEEVVGIFTIAREFSTTYAREGRVRNVLYHDFHQLGRELGVPVVEVENGLGGRLGDFLEMRPDFALAAGWYYMIPEAFRAAVSKGITALHASLLPAYRGGAPLVWAIINGQTEAGLSLFYLDGGVDSGDLVAQAKFSIGRQETIADVLIKAESASLALVEAYVPQIRLGTAPRTPQALRASRVYPQRSPRDGRIDWSWSAERIYDFVRAQTRPYPGSFTLLADRRVTIWRAAVRPADFLDGPPPEVGRIRLLADDPDEVLIGCGSPAALVSVRREDLEGWVPSGADRAAPGLAFT